MPKFLEKKLAKEYGKGSSVIYKVMNKMGAMKGNKITAKGKAMEKKHNLAKRLEKHGIARSYSK